jgi:hypothetical protein
MSGYYNQNLSKSEINFLRDLLSEHGVKCVLQCISNIYKIESKHILTCGNIVHYQAQKRIDIAKWIDDYINSDSFTNVFLYTYNIAHMA